MTKNPNQNMQGKKQNQNMQEEFASETDVNQVKKQNQQSMQNKSKMGTGNAQQNQNSSTMQEEFASETDINQVKMQNQQSESNKKGYTAARNLNNGSK
ncbi:gamma-type small acid-soluble spore protein [Sporosarcina siberiensis]|uniref:Small, acid-soluble spore protein gamma-type n=1 Tax=Sporosarcina siberiensis TaxID=1365606 RepID=A0ABW4SEM3_9BACL